MSIKEYIKISSKLVLLAGFVIFAHFNFLANISAQSFTENVLDSNDITAIESPRPNVTIIGTTELKFKVYDDDTSTIPTRIEVLDKSCEVKRRTILNATMPSKKTSQIKGWDTNAGYQDGNKLSDGTYCLSLCTDLKLNATSYSVCRRQEVTLRNRPNNPPKITSTPVTKITKGSDYSYSVVASDLDGDRLHYRFTQKPGFLGTNGNTISGKGLNQVGDYKIVVEVTDDFGGLARQTYTLSVSEPKVAEQPTPTTPEEPDEKPTDEEKPLSVNFIYPQEGSVLSGKESIIEWSLKNTSNKTIESFILQYSTADEENWQEIFSTGQDELKTSNSYSWDVSEIENGSYKLRIVIKQKDLEEITTESSIFEINNDQGGTTEQPKVTISDLNPENGAAINEIEDGKISFKVTLSKEVEDSLNTEDLSISVNGEDIKDKCDIEKLNEREYQVSCEYSKSEPDTYEIKVNIDKHAFEQSWKFNIVEDSVDSGPTDLNSYAPLAAVACVVLFLLLLPLLLLFIIRRRRDSYYIEEEEVTTTTSTTPGDSEYKIGDAFSAGSITTNYMNTPDTVSTTTETTITKEEKTEEKKPGIFSGISNAINKSKAKIQKTIVDRRVKKETSKEQEVKEPLATASTSTILEGNDQEVYSLSDNFAGDNPVAPTANESQPQTATTSTNTTTEKEEKVGISNDDLPEWLRSSDTENSITTTNTTEPAQESKKTDNGLNDDEDDGSDPYGFGEYTIGTPN